MGVVLVAVVRRRHHHYLTPAGLPGLEPKSPGHPLHQRLLLLLSSRLLSKEERCLAGFNSAARRCRCRDVRTRGCVALNAGKAPLNGASCRPKPHGTPASEAHRRRSHPLLWPFFCRRSSPFLSRSSPSGWEEKGDRGKRANG